MTHIGGTIQYCNFIWFFWMFLHVAKRIVWVGNFQIHLSHETATIIMTGRPPPLPLTYHSLKQKALWSGLITYWFPLKRAAIKTLIDRGGRLKGHKTSHHQGGHVTFTDQHLKLVPEAGAPHTVGIARYHTSPGGWWLVVVVAGACGGWL